MPTRSSSLGNNVSTAVDREIGSQYDDVRVVAENIESVVTVADHIENVDTVATNIVDVHAVGGSIVDVRTVAANISNVVAVGQDIANINVAAANADNIDMIVAEVIPNINEITNASANAAIATAKANEAATSAANALVSEQNAKASELAAGVSEDNAAASEVVAIAKAGEASASATAARNSELAAAAMLDAFDDRYLGSFTVDPTTDNDGQPLLDGALYFNTSENVLKVYDVGTTTWYTIPQVQLSTLLDVQLTSVTTGDMLNWNGTKWVNTSSVREHIADTSNPHSVTKAQVELGNVDNTADVDKNVLSATKWTTARTISSTGDVTWETTLDGSVDATGVATLANSGIVAGTYNNSATAVKPLIVDAKGRITDVGLDVTITPAWSSVTSTPTTISGYGITDAYTKTEVQNAYEPKNTNIQAHISSTSNPHNVTKTQVGLGNVDNTSDINKPISTATQNALDLKAPLASPALTGTPTAPTATVGDSSTQLATTAFVNAEIVDYTYSKTEINTKLAAQNDASEISVTPSGNLASTNVQAALVELQGDIDIRYTKTETDTLLANKAADSLVVHKTGDETIAGVKTFSSSPIVPTPTAGDNSTKVATTAFVVSYNAIEQTETPIFGLIWNQTDDMYKRIGKNVNYASIDGTGEFTSWKSPTAERQNDSDTINGSPLTTWLDTSTNLPFSSMKRYVIDNTGAEVKAYNADSFTHADQTSIASNQQIMVKIPQFNYIQAKIVDGGKTYHIYAVAKSAFTLDALSDLGFMTPVITVWNPTTGVSSGTVAGNVLSSALHPAFVDNVGTTLTKRYYGAFNAVSGRSVCGASVRPTASIALATARTQCQGFGTGFTQLDFFLESAKNILALIERGSFYFERGGASLGNKWEGNSATYDGSQTSYNRDNGLTLALLNKTGVILDASNRTIANSYRGIENYHSALWRLVDGVSLSANKVYLAKPKATFSDGTITAPYFYSGYTVPSGASASYIADLGAGSFIPVTLGGSASTKVTDGAWTGSTALSVGGNLARAYISGLCTWDLSSAASYASWTIVSRSGL